MNIMSQIKKKIKKESKPYLDVDVFQKTFSNISTQAVYDIFKKEFKIKDFNTYKYPFIHCLENLRLLRDPSYIFLNDTKIQSID